MKKYIPLIIGLVAFAYYSVLSAKEYTWVFVSGDSGDWLAASTWWMVPQPLGSPLYILLGQFLNLFPGDLVIKMTICLSVIPSAITVALVYLIVKKLTNNYRVAIVSSLVLLGATVFLTQSTVLEEYALTTTLLALAYYMHLKERRYLTVVSLALSTAVHAVIGGVILFWIIIGITDWRRLIKQLAIYATIVVAFYSLVPVLMAMDTPRLLAGGFNIESIRLYTTVITGQIVGQVSLFDMPTRLFDVSRILLMSFGLALVPVAYAMRLPIPRFKLVLFGSLTFILWFYITNLDKQTWTFLTIISPAIAILVGIGLSRLNGIHLRLVLASALLLIVFNGMFMNANTLTDERPLAKEYYEALQTLPENSVVLTNAGSYSLGLFYAMSNGREDLVPLIFPYLEIWRFTDYRVWLHDNYLSGMPITWNTLEVIEWTLENGRRVYYADSEGIDSMILEYLELRGDAPIKEVMSVEIPVQHFGNY